MDGIVAGISAPCSAHNAARLWTRDTFAITYHAGWRHCSYSMCLGVGRGLLHLSCGNRGRLPSNPTQFIKTNVSGISNCQSTPAIDMAIHVFRKSPIISVNRCWITWMNSSRVTSKGTRKHTCFGGLKVRILKINQELVRLTHSKFAILDSKMQPQRGIF